MSTDYTLAYGTHATRGGAVRDGMGQLSRGLSA
jgi:hypothetical protein